MIDAENLETKAIVTEVSIDDAGTVTGIAWPFGKADTWGDLIEPGAFNFAPEVPMLMEHKHREGAVGIWNTLNVTDKGLEVKGRLFVEGVEPAQHARRLMKTRAMSGLSIGYRLHEFKARPEGGRVLTSLTITEISLCRKPVHPDANAEVKSIIEGNNMENEEIENALEAKADPVVSPQELKAIRARMDKLEAKANRPLTANNNHPAGANDNTERKAINDELRGFLLEKKALTIAAPGTAGNLINDTVASRILERVGKSNPIRKLAQSIQIGGGIFNIPRLVDSVAPGSVTETQAKPESAPTFEQISLQPYMMGAKVLVSRSTIEDSIVDLVAWLSTHIADKFGELESSWFIGGNGTSQAEGVMTSAEVQQLTATTTTLTVDALLDLFYSIKTTYSDNGSWIMNRKAMRALRGLKDSDGNLIWQPGLQAGQPAMLLDRPVYASDDMPDPVAGATPIMFGDFYRGYLIADRVAFEPVVNYDNEWEVDLVEFGGRRRVGGKVVMGEALSKLKLKAA